LAPEPTARPKRPGKKSSFNEGAPSLAPEHGIYGGHLPVSRGFNEGAPSLAPEQGNAFANGRLKLPSMRGRQAWRPNLAVPKVLNVPKNPFNEGAPSLAPEHGWRLWGEPHRYPFNEGAPSLAPEQRYKPARPTTICAFNEGAPSLAPEQQVSDFQL